MGGSAKIKVSCWLCSKAHPDWFWKDFAPRHGTILGSKWDAAALSKATVTKYENRGGAESINYPPF